MVRGKRNDKGERAGQKGGRLIWGRRRGAPRVNSLRGRTGAESERDRTQRAGILRARSSRSSTSPNSLSNSNENSMSRPLSGLLPTTPSRKSRQNLRFFRRSKKLRKN